MTSRTGRAHEGYWGDLKKSVSWVENWTSEREGSTFGARRGQTNLRATGAARNGGGGCSDGKVIIERLCISLPYVETFNSKVIKGFVPELRSRYVFFVFLDSYDLCIYVMNILCTFQYIRIMGMIQWVKHCVFIFCGFDIAICSWYSHKVEIKFFKCVKSLRNTECFKTNAVIFPSLLSFFLSFQSHFHICTRQLSLAKGHQYRALYENQIKRHSSIWQKGTNVGHSVRTKLTLTVMVYEQGFIDSCWYFQTLSGTRSPQWITWWG